ncbi:MAG TPA: tripartite tricarboxylate transporter substrate binding protein [Burkholderiales bacterium]|nr:tripartite tricarboxylate transporter substrate binding protein [Burkholderiales bacterium]
MTKRLIAAAVLTCTIAALMAAASASAQDKYPSRAVRLIVPFAPGGGADISGRTIAARLTERFGQQVIVDNRPGAGGNVGVELASKSPPDGYTLLLVSSSYGANPSLYKLSFDPVNGFEPITLVSQQPFILVVHPSLPARSVKELIALAKAKPGSLNYASSGAGGIVHLGTEYFKSVAGIDIVHIPYKGGNTAHNDLVAGFVQVYFGTILSTLPVVKSGKVRALAVSTDRRNAALPDIPTVAEAGLPGFSFGGWYALLAPAKTPKEITTLLNREVVALLQAADVKERLAAEGSTVVASTPEQLRQHLQRDIAKWQKVVKTANIRLDASQ